ncbi:MAG: arylformamidase [Chloroflexi bacterium]|nr:arylformamidase [Chloroflexota bacterium]
MSRIYDISRTISAHTAVWPGDRPFSYQQPLRIRQGASVNLTTLTLSAHTGTHADAPYHFDDAGAFPAALPLERYLGPALVVSIARRSGGIVPADVAGHDLRGMQRVLLHTWVSALADNVWPEDFPYPTLALIDWLAARGVLLLGVDMPSVDPFESKTLDGHHRLHQHGMAHLESLCLHEVPDGAYELIALPLKLAPACASPVRAALRTLE